MKGFTIHDRSVYSIGGFEKGLAGGGWRHTDPPKSSPDVCPLLLRGHRKRVQKRGLNLWPLRGLLAPTPPLSANPFSKLLTQVGCTPRGSCNRTLLRSVLRRFFKKEVLLRRVLRRNLVRISVGTGVLGRVLRRGGCYRRRLEVA